LCPDREWEVQTGLSVCTALRSLSLRVGLLDSAYWESITKLLRTVEHHPHLEVIRLVLTHEKTFMAFENEDLDICSVAEIDGFQFPSLRRFLCSNYCLWDSDDDENEDRDLIHMVWPTLVKRGLLDYETFKFYTVRKTKLYTRDVI
jgi:hypothetical protein